MNAVFSLAPSPWRRRRFPHRSRRRSIRLAVALALALALSFTLSAMTACSPTYANRVPAAQALTSQPARYSVADLAGEVHRRVNQARVEHGLKPVTWNAELLPIATAHSRDMARRGYFAHVTPEGVNPLMRYQRAGYRCQVPKGGGRFLTAGENLILTHRVRSYQVWPDGHKAPYQYYTLAGLADRVVTGWLNSPKHREVMLTPEWRTEAIGIYIAADGRVWATQNFC